tara:strand:- start:501 stop:1571 length:1071 start_codon:yes stop_codon:yes gene_type:complete
MSLINHIIYATNVHQGGGKVLLLPILEELKKNKNTIFILDKRLKLPKSLFLKGRIIWVSPNLIGRFVLECKLLKLITKETRITCMGNLPPLWAKSKHIEVFVQNRYIIESLSLSHFSFWVQMRIHLERWWLKTRAYRVNHFIVQTKSMSRLMQLKLWRVPSILPYTILPKVTKNKSDLKLKNIYDYVYIASGAPHKNHRRLVEAWQIMAKHGIFPSLCLTIDKNNELELFRWIDARCQKYDLKIEMVGELDHSEVQDLYNRSRVLVYPSLVESLGLPLLESAASGLMIIASDLDYVHDIVKPTAVFNPYSPEAIADTLMKKHPKSKVKILTKLETASSFLKHTHSYNKLWSNELEV